MTAIALVNISIMSHNYHCFFVVRTFKTYRLSNFQVYTTVLLITARPIYNLQL